VNPNNVDVAKVKQCQKIVRRYLGRVESVKEMRKRRASVWETRRKILSEIYETERGFVVAILLLLLLFSCSLSLSLSLSRNLTSLLYVLLSLLSLLLLLLLFSL